MSKMIALLVILTMIAVPAVAQERPQADFKVVSYRHVYDPSDQLWPDKCVVVAESKTVRITGMYPVYCSKISVGDPAVFNHKGDTVFWVNDQPYSVQLAVAKVTAVRK